MRTQESGYAMSGLNLWLHKRWFSLLVIVSALLAIVTFASYALQGSGLLSKVLFRVGLGGENCVGAWWSGMLLLGAVFSFDGPLLKDRSVQERRGWLMLGFILLCMSFDEIGSVHEGMSFKIIGAIGLSMLVFSLIELSKGRIARRTFVRILVGFGLLGTIAIQERLQHSLQWNNQIIYGARAMLEEGTELCGMLVLLSATVANTRDFLSRHPDLAMNLTVFGRKRILIAAIVLAPTLSAATFILPYPGGPANWIASSLYLLCALAVIRGSLMGQHRPDARIALLLAFYICASVASCSIRFTDDVTLFNIPVSLRGIALCATLLGAASLLRTMGRRARWDRMKLGAFTIFVMAWWPQEPSMLSQFLWCFVPTIVAVWIYAVESGHWEKIFVRIS